MVIGREDDVMLLFFHFAGPATSKMNMTYTIFFYFDIIIYTCGIIIAKFVCVNVYSKVNFDPNSERHVAVNSSQACLGYGDVSVSVGKIPTLSRLLPRLKAPHRMVASR